METRKEDANAKGKRYVKGVKGNTRAKLRLCTKRLSKRHKCRLRRRMKKAALLALMQGTVMEAGTSVETLPCTSAADDFIADAICEGNVIYFKEEIIDDISEADFHTDGAEYSEEADSEAIVNRRWMNSEECRTVRQGTAAEAGTCAGTSLETLPCTSAADDFLADAICEGNVIYFKEEIIDDISEADFHMDEVENGEELNSEALVNL